MKKSTVTRYCDHCRTLYQAKKPSSKYCSDTCRVMAYKKRHGIPLPDFSSLTAIQSKFQSPEDIRIRDLSNQLLVLASRRRGAEAEYERCRKHFERTDEKLRERLENRHGVFLSSSIEYAEREREEAVAAMNTAAQRLSDIDLQAARLQSQLATAQERSAIQNIEKRREVISSKALRSKTFDVLPVEGAWRPFLGRPERGFLLALHGTPFSGKSSLCLRLLDYLSRFGSCVYVSAEEGISESFKLKVQQWLSPASDITISAERIPAGIKRTIRKFQFAVIDSVQAATLSVADLEDLSNGQTSIIAILQSTKTGEYRGGAGYAHLADIIWAVSIVDGHQKIEVEKNRFL